MEGVKEIPQERFPEQSVEQIANAIEEVTPEPGVPSATPVPALDMSPQEKFGEACRILDLKQVEFREAELMVERMRTLFPRPGKLKNP